MTATAKPANRRAGPVAARNSWRRMGARWLLLGAVIAGVLAIHLLGAADSGGNHPPMATTPGSSSSPGMSMDIPMPGVDMAPPAYPGTATKLSSVLGTGMAPMSCCVLFFVSAAGLVLLTRSTKPATNPAAAGIRGRAAHGVPQRGPPGPGRPRIALSILRT